MGNELIERYSNLVWKFVRSFARKFDGFKNFPVIDVDDLYQECMEDMLQDFLNSGKSEQEFECNHMRLFHCMHLYVKKCLPVRTTYNTKTYTQDMRKYANTVNVDDVLDLAYANEADHDFEADCDRVQERLTDVQQKMFIRFRQGYPDRMIMKDLGITVGKLRNHRIKIAHIYNVTNGQKHICKWKEH